MFKSPFKLLKTHSLLQDVILSDKSLHNGQASAILLPLEASLSTDVAALSDGAFSRERETKADLSPMHGQALYKFYCFTLRESCPLLRSLVSSITYSVKELHSLVTKLVKTASHRASNLHKVMNHILLFIS